MNLDILLLYFQLLALAKQIGVCLETGGQSLNLSVLCGVINCSATIYVVITKFTADNDILNIDVVAITTSTTTADDDIRVEIVNHLLGT